VVDGVLLLLPSAAAPVTLSEAASQVWEALGPPGAGSAEVGNLPGRPLRLQPAELHRALKELVDLGVLVRR
jgi:hypothetical protein